eukprot:1354609-Amorphochlora_amoeboformis.AAC.1
MIFPALTLLSLVNGMVDRASQRQNKELSSRKIEVSNGLRGLRANVTASGTRAEPQGPPVWEPIVTDLREDIGFDPRPNDHPPF